MRSKHFLLLSLALLLSLSSVIAADFHVSSDGDDAGDGSRQAPFASITRAAKAAGPGDTVHIGPGLYREQPSFRRSGQKGAPIIFQGSRGSNGEFLSIIEPDGKTLTDWQEAAEIGPGVWKSPLAERPDLAMCDGKMIAYINRLTMQLPEWESLPQEINENMLWSKFGPECKRLPGLDLLRLPADIQVKHRYFGERKELFWPALAHILSAWKDGFFYVRFANDASPAQHRITVVSGNGFVLENRQHLLIRDLHLRGSRCQIELNGKNCSHNVIERCLLMHGGRRIWLRNGAHHNLIRDNILTAGFIQSDNFKLRAPDDMRGGLMYLIFKYIIGTSSSDDIGVYITSPDNTVKDNFILQGLIGIDALAPGLECSGNVIREMSSVGLCTGNGCVGDFHHNIYANCGIPLRIHDLRHKRDQRLEYHHHNLLIQRPDAGSQIYVHCESHLLNFADAENFDFIDGKYIYKAEPPNPVDAGKIYIYHNTLYGGSSSPPFTVNYLSIRFRDKMPFFFANNIARAATNIALKSQELMAGNLYYHFPNNKATQFREPEVSVHNLVLAPEQFASLWNNASQDGMPDLTLGKDSPALGRGLDLSKPYTEGQQLPSLPGLETGYFKGAAPAPGAFQEGETQAYFQAKYRRSNEIIQMIKKLQ